MSETKKKKSKKKIVIIAVIALAVLGVAAKLVLGGGGGTATPVSVGTVEKTDLQQTVAIKGTIKGSDSADVYSSSPNKVTSVLVEEGDTVKAGQILATLESDDTQDSLAKAQLALSDSKRGYEISKTLYEEGAISKEEYLKAKTAYEADKLTVQSINNGDDKNIKSPIDGTVTRVNTTVGKLASSNVNEPVFVIENVNDLQMEVKVSEYDISKIKVGQSVTISAEVLGNQTVTGVVSHISPTGEAKEAGSSSMVIPVTIDVDKGDTNLIAGVTAKATILIDQKVNTLAVPIDAILEDSETGASYIFIVNDKNVLERKDVEVGLEGDFYVEISADGVEEGQQVVLAPDMTYYDGMPVSLDPYN